jgi:hypothetical protein
MAGIGVLGKIHKKIFESLTFESSQTFQKAITVSGVDSDNTISWTGTNTGATPCLKLPDDTHIADADGAVGAAAGFIVVDIGGSNYKLRTYATA